MKLFIKSLSGEVIFTIRCNKKQSVYSVIKKCRDINNTIFKLVILEPKYKLLNQLKSLEEEGIINKREELYVIFNSELPEVIENIRNNKQILGYFKNLVEEFKKDKEIVLEAVKNHGYALEYASERLRDETEVVLEAVKNYGDALYYTSVELRKDKDILAIVNEHLIS